MPSLPYVVALVVVAAVLYLSFRALGGGEVSASAPDVRDTLVRIAGEAAARAGELRAALADPAAAVPQGERGESRLTTTAAAARRHLAGRQQQLSRLSGEAQEEPVEAARTLLGAAVDDLTWACRLVESAGFRDNPGLRNAAGALLDHAEECVAAAQAVVGQPA